MEQIKMTQDEFLAWRGFLFPVSDYMLDKLRHPHGLTLRQRKKLEKDNIRAANDYAEQRRAAIKEYQEQVKAGTIVEKSSVEIIIERAKYGHPDNEATQSARRVLEKRGISWRQEP